MALLGYIDGDLHVPGDIFTASSSDGGYTLIAPESNEGVADNYLRISGGRDADGNSDGAVLALYGNFHDTYDGHAYLTSGDSGEVHLQMAGVDAINIGTNIVTTLPVYHFDPLTVTEDGGAIVLTQASTPADSYIYWKDNTSAETAWVGFWQDNRFNIWNKRNTDLRIATNNAVAITVAAAGTTQVHSRLGVGTAPSATLALSTLSGATTSGSMRALADLTDTASPAEGVGGGAFFGAQYASGQYATMGGIQAVKANSDSGDYSSILQLIGRTHGSAPHIAAAYNGEEEIWYFRGVIKDEAGDYVLDLDNSGDASIKHSGSEEGITVSSDGLHIDQGLIIAGTELSAGNLPSGATAAAAGASSGQFWVTSGHATLPDGVVMRA
jgi:hypothetical protein